MDNRIRTILIVFLVLSIPFVQSMTIAPEPSLSGEYCTPTYNDCPYETYCSGKRNGLEMNKCCPNNSTYDFVRDTCQVKCIDLDNDGYGVNCVIGEDCDDFDSKINKGMVEYCDNVDNNCNNETDEECVDIPEPDFTATPIEEYEEIDLSCDGIGIELCNGIDDNCNNITDEDCLDLEYIDSDSNKSLEFTHYEGKTGIGQTGCFFNDDCDEGLVCAWESWFSFGGICCLDGQLTDGSTCYYLGENEGDCDEDKQCKQGMHCSKTESGAWLPDLEDDVCCPGTKEYNKETRTCEECGVWAMPNDSDYCALKTDIGCGCNPEQGDCDIKDECVITSYCHQNGILSTDYCCLKGHYWNGNNCVPSTLNVTCEDCPDCDENKCYSIGPECKWRAGNCETITSLDHNEGSCQDNDTICCDMDNNCNRRVDLKCMNDGFVSTPSMEFTVCCYPWEKQGPSGRCILETPKTDGDDDGWWDRVEVEVGSNPRETRDTPTLRLAIVDAGSFWVIPADRDLGAFLLDLLDMMISILPLVKKLIVGDISGATSIVYGTVTGFISGAIFGLVDDISFAAMLIKFVLYVNIKLTAIMNETLLSHDTSSAVEALESAGYTVAGIYNGIGQALGNLGELFQEMGNQGLDTLEQRALSISPYDREDTSIMMVKGFVRGYILGFIVEQIFLLKGASAIKSAKISKFFKAIDFINDVPVEIVKAGAGLGIDYLIVPVLRVLKITDAAKWMSDQILMSVALLVQKRSEKYVQKLFTELGEDGAHVMVSKISRLVDDIGEVKVAALLKSDLGMRTFQAGWSDYSQKILADMLHAKGKRFYNRAFKGLTDEELAEIGRLIDNMPEERARLLLNSESGPRMILNGATGGIDELLEFLNRMDPIRKQLFLDHPRGLEIAQQLLDAVKLYDNGAPKKEVIEALKKVEGIEHTGSMDNLFAEFPTEEIPISKLRGHGTDDPRNILRKAEHQHQKNPIWVIRVGEEYMIYDGVGRTTRSIWKGETIVNAKVIREYDSADELLELAGSSQQARTDAHQWTNIVEKIDPDEKLRLLFGDEAEFLAYRITQDFSEDVINTLSARADYADILTGYAVKLDLEKRLKHVFQSISIPNNAEDAALALKFFNAQEVQQQFVWMEKIGFDNPEKIGFTFSRIEGPY
ncbi:MopE-related protein, partial [Nanoarchaeota archaeon]